MRGNGYKDVTNKDMILYTMKRVDDLHKEISKLSSDIVTEKECIQHRNRKDNAFWKHIQALLSVAAIIISVLVASGTI